MTALDSTGVLPDGIYSRLRIAIIDQSHPPGSAITETLVASQFGVARPTARLAIERLVGEGLLRRENHRAARVPQLDRDDISDIFDNRAVVETEAAFALAGLGGVPLPAVRAHDALLHDVATGAPFAAHDSAFHRSLVEGQPSPRLARLHSLLMGEVDLCIGQIQAGHLRHPDDVAREHQGILDAIVARDPAQAARLTREHIRSSRDALLAQWDARADG
jgi:DNA-binding GntR family transcriptional regulator